MVLLLVSVSMLVVAAPVPAPGRDAVPRNPLIVVDDTVNAVELVDEDRAVVACDSVLVTGDQLVPVRRLVPTTTLRAQTTYTVSARVDGVPAELTRFTTGDDVDDDAPDVPVVFRDDDGLTVWSNEPLPIADLRVEQGSQVFLHLDDDGHVPFLLVGDRELQMTVVALDAAGNTSAPVDVDDPDPVKHGDGGGCASTPASAGAPIAALLLVLRRRRR